MKSTNIDTLKSNDSTVTCYIYGKSNRDIDPIGVIDLEIKLLILLLLVHTFEKENVGTIQRHT